MRRPQMPDVPFTDRDTPALPVPQLSRAATFKLARYRMRGGVLDARVRGRVRGHDTGLGLFRPRGPAAGRYELAMTGEASWFCSYTR